MAMAESHHPIPFLEVTKGEVVVKGNPSISQELAARADAPHRRSTWVGDLAAGALTRIADIAEQKLPAAIVTVYRWMPDSARGVVFGGPSTSDLAERGLSKGLGWKVVRAAISNHPDRPPLP